MEYFDNFFEIDVDPLKLEAFELPPFIVLEQRNFKFFFSVPLDSRKFKLFLWNASQMESTNQIPFVFYQSAQ